MRGVIRMWPRSGRSGPHQRARTVRPAAADRAPAAAPPSKHEVLQPYRTAPPRLRDRSPRAQKRKASQSVRSTWPACGAVIAARCAVLRDASGGPRGPLALALIPVRHAIGPGLGHLEGSRRERCSISAGRPRWPRRSGRPPQRTVGSGSPGPGPQIELAQVSMCAGEEYGRSPLGQGQAGAGRVHHQ